ncbi:MAG: UDP-glucose 4-epimerase [Chloroflexi bacterium HGW-Chloroflexi-1]|nr:MAG: UDP-glucose 4-epimerase [Chloroflexi bacterium HGW-Chloroflexi-1]
MILPSKAIADAQEAPVSPPRGRGAVAPRHILVTGGAGFIGSHVVDAFIEAGHEVAVVDNLHTGKRENINPAARFYEVDIRDVSALAEVFAAEKPTAVSHQAALADVRSSLADPVSYAQVNIIGALNLLEMCRQHGVHRFLFASTGGAVYGEPEELPASETCPTRPLDPYGVSKLAGEQFIDTYRHNYGLQYTILRYGNVYGPRQDPFGEAGVVAIFTSAMLRGQPVVINGDGLQQRDFVYVGDVARANVLALSISGSGIYNLGTGVPANIVTIFRELAQGAGYTLPEQHGPAKAGEVRVTYLDAALAQRELGWQPSVTLAEGLTRTVAWFRGFCS